MINLCFLNFCQLDFWKAPHKPGLAVDIHVTDAAYKIVAKLLKEKNIEFQIMIVDVDKLVDDENELQTRSMSFSFDSQYHPLQEVSRVFFDRKKAD